MESLIQPASDLISRHHEWAALVLGLATFLESLVFVGAFVPATALMLIAGGLMAKGFLDPLPVILACVAGAVVGNAISFAMGRRLGRRALRHPLLHRHRRMVARTRLLCQRYGTASIYAGRFLGPLRALVPVTVGMLRMRRRKFQIANFISAPVWVLAMLAPGYFAVKGLAELELLGEADTITLILIGTVLALLVVFAMAPLARAGWRRRGDTASRAVRARQAVRGPERPEHMFLP